MGQREKCRRGGSCAGEGVWVCIRAWACRVCRALVKRGKGHHPYVGKEAGVNCPSSKAPLAYGASALQAIAVGGLKACVDARLRTGLLAPVR